MRGFVFRLTASVDIVSPATVIDFGKVRVTWKRKDGTDLSSTCMDIPKMDFPSELIRIVASNLVLT
jgi:hypothetical protein